MKRMNLRNITLSEISQAENEKCHMISLITGIETRQIHRRVEEWSSEIKVEKVNGER